MRLSDAGSWQIPGPCLLPLQLSFSLITDKVQVLHTCPSLQKGGDSKKLLGVTDSDRAEESCRGRTGTRAHPHPTKYLTIFSTTSVDMQSEAAGLGFLLLAFHLQGGGAGPWLGFLGCVPSPSHGPHQSPGVQTPTSGGPLFYLCPEKGD